MGNKDLQLVVDCNFWQQFLIILILFLITQLHEPGKYAQNCLFYS